MMNTSSKSTSPAVLDYARWASLTVGILTALLSAFSFIPPIVRYGFDMAIDWPILIIVTVGDKVPLLLAALAWRRHLTGGLAIVAFTIAFLPFALLYIGSGDLAAWVFYVGHSVFALTFLSGGVMHLLVWRNDRRQSPLHPPQPAQEIEANTPSHSPKHAFTVTPPTAL